MASVHLRTKRHGYAADLALAAVVAGAVATLLLPVPPGILDVLLAVNLGASFVILLVAVHAPSPLAVSSFPTLLLVSTLYRLALDVAAARLILGRGEAGAIIHTFGRVLIGGNFVVGLVVFAIITLVQYLVIARGAGRVAEVAARFALDALPGRQLAIDADLRAGSVDSAEALRRRSELSRESQFYGAMDGAMRFVRGDAIAGMAVVAVDLLGGLVMAGGQRGMELSAMLYQVGLLTVGQGLVAQIPSLVTATAAGVLVTRVASAEGETSLARDLVQQFTRQPRALAMAAGLLGVVALAPGLPVLPFAALGALCAAGAWVARADNVARRESADLGVFAAVTVTLGPAHHALTAAGGLDDRIEARRAALSRELGIALPGATVQTLSEGPSGDVTVAVHEVPAVRAEVSVGPGAPDAIADLYERALRDHPGLFVGISEVRGLLDGLVRVHPALVREVVPRPVSVPLLADVLRRLVGEGVSVRNLRAVLEAVADAAAGGERDARVLTERVRTALRREISYRYAPGGTLAPWLLDPEIEDAVREAVRRGAGTPADASLADDLCTAAGRALAASPGEALAVVLTQPDVRRWVREMLAPAFPRVAVLAYGELEPGVRVTPAGTITP